jgi:hypothetical protein
MRAAISSGGDVNSGNATVTNSVPPNKRLVTFGQSAAGCVPTATLARNERGATVDPGPGRVVVAIEDTRVAVETFTADGTPAFLPFNVAVAC